MYTLPAFKITDQKTIHDFIHKYSFATVVVNNGNRPEATHVPVLFNHLTNELSFHLASANPMTHIFKENKDILIIFQGPHAYISPRWYSKPRVPTWNYTSVHIYGKAEQITAPKSLLNDLKELVRVYDQQIFTESLFGDHSAIVEQLIPAIQCFKVKIENIEAKFKLGQNLDQKSINNVIKELLSSSNNSDIELGKFMEAYSSLTP